MGKEEGRNPGAVSHHPSPTPDQVQRGQTLHPSPANHFRKGGAHPTQNIIKPWVQDAPVHVLPSRRSQSGSRHSCGLGVWWWGAVRAQRWGEHVTRPMENSLTEPDSSPGLQIRPSLGQEVPPEDGVFRLEQSGWTERNRITEDK